MVCDLQHWLDADIAQPHSRCVPTTWWARAHIFARIYTSANCLSMNVRLKRFEPSMVAAAAIHLALHTRNRSLWSTPPPPF